MFSCSLIRLQQFRPLLARTRAIYVIAPVLRKLVSCSHEIGRCMLYTLFVRVTKLRIVWPIMVILLVLDFILFISSHVRCLIVFVRIRWEFIFLVRFL
ncbi:hypothetical protein LINGRAHAP2_LOCUS35133 [Linum grandiflorum]